jgi:hypothetical protein
MTILHLLTSKTCNSNHLVANGSAWVETWRLLATSFGLRELALRIFHNRWLECGQPSMGQTSTNQRLVLMYWTHNVFFSDILCEEGL